MNSAATCHEFQVASNLRIAFSAAVVSHSCAGHANPLPSANPFAESTWPI